MSEEKTMNEAEKDASQVQEAPKTSSEAPSTPSAKEERGGRSRSRGRRERGTPREPKEFEEAVLQIDRVTRVVKGGRRLRFRVSVVIGDQKGRVGFGIGKAAEVMIGIQKAVAKAKKSLIKIPIVKGTIPHPINESYKASRVLLFPAPAGKGVIAGGAVRRILELVGIKDVLSKVHGSRNKINIARATMNALKRFQNIVIEEEASPEVKVKQETPKKTLAKKEVKTSKKPSSQSKK